MRLFVIPNRIVEIEVGEDDERSIPAPAAEDKPTDAERRIRGWIERGTECSITTSLTVVLLFTVGGT